MPAGSDRKTKRHNNMETLFIVIVAVLLLLAVCDLSVGVSNDAVNFMNSAVGSKAARYRTILIVAAVGIFAGATVSNGMMDIARHGIFTPTYFSFYDVMCLFIVVMVTDVILLDIFNTLGLPTSTTVSMVFELLGGAFGIAIIKIAHGVTDGSGVPLTFGDLLNTEKALSVIIGIFLSVAVAFVLGSLVQWIARMIFTFTYKRNSAGRTVVFGTVVATSMMWFLLISGLKQSTFMTGELEDFVTGNTWTIIGLGFVFFAVLMSVLHVLKVNILKVVVLMGTFSLAMAFAGNDLVNFIGVPLAGLESFMDYSANGTGNPASFMMTSLNGSSHTPAVILAVAGMIMVLSLVFSRKAHNVTKTEIGLSSHADGDEMFGTSVVARVLVRMATNVAQTVSGYVPCRVKTWVNSRFVSDGEELENGAAYDLVRASTNLMIAGILVAFGTSHKLPLSTTYVTFMVAMGASLADRAWSRESAVYRITGVISVIGGWFITAGVAFTLCFILANIVYFGGYVAMALVVALGVAVLIISNRHYNRKTKAEETDTAFRKMLDTDDKRESWILLGDHVRESAVHGLVFTANIYKEVTDGFFNNDYRELRRCVSKFKDERAHLKQMRRREIIGLRRIDPVMAIERNTWYFLQNNSLMQLLYCLKRTCDPCLEHVSNSFSPAPADICDSFVNIREHILQLLEDTIALVKSGLVDGEFKAKADKLRKDGDELQLRLSAFHKTMLDQMQNEQCKINTLLVAVNITQESQQLISSTRHLLKGLSRFLD